jgi:hypothetical protein
VVAIVAVLVLLGGGVAIVSALDKKDDGNTAAGRSPAPTLEPPSGLPSDIPSVPALPSVPDFPNPSDLPSGSPSTDQSMFVQEGDCVRISGKAPNLKMFKVDCDRAQYKVLKRFSGTSDQKKCHSVNGYTTAFYAKSEKYSFLSYVLCLKHE